MRRQVISIKAIKKEPKGNSEIIIIFMDLEWIQHKRKKINKLEDNSVEITQSETQMGKRV